ncbi:MAG: membrane protein insertase YidC [Treponema sp.]|jgi:YidC/Oxa1 family membrane protein insertase|nr:membrane protein insertase YidC [Treponema sp.]
MEKNTLLAVVLSIVVISAFYLVQGIFFPAQPAVPVPAASGGQSAVTEAPALPPEQTAPAEPGAQPSPDTGISGAGAETAGESPDPGPAAEQRVTIDIPGKDGAPLITAVLTNAGGDLVSWKLREHNDKDDSVEMVFSGDTEAHAFTVAFGNLNAQPVTSLFYVNRISEYSVEFYRDFTLPSSGPGAAPGRFRLTKRYDFKPREYMFELTLILDGGYSVPGFNFSGAAYTLAFGPQIGPRFEKLDGRYESRSYLTYVNGKRRTEKVNDNKPEIISSRPTWAAIAGKYFAFIAIPYLAQYDLNFSTKSEPGLPAASRLNIIRPPLNSSRAEDTYRFYLGPKTQEVLALYNNGNNAYGVKDMQLIEAANSKGFLSPLEKILKWFLLLFYKLIPNYGIAIILLTLLVKVVFFPLTKKGSEATLRMQAISPKIKELQEKYKDNPQKMNAEMAELYKKEGYNPLSGCLPMLLQIPIFFAMYNLFNNHFDLRGAMFIPRWIPDLSLPEAVYTFSTFRIPILGWNAIRALPFIYVGSQLLYGRVTQTPDQQGNAQMKMMLYVMPIMFFFILYDVPSGLLIYWIFSNVLTMVQQVAINKYLAPKRAAQAAAQAGPVIAPRRKKKK